MKEWQEKIKRLDIYIEIKNDFSKLR